MQHILIVDDEKIFRDYLRTSIPWEDYGFEITGEAKHGKEALAFIAEGKVDIALVDISMPQMNGIELSKEVRRMYPLIKIVLVTGHNEFEYAKQALKLGVSDYILKPFSKEELTLTLLKLKEHIETDRKEQETYKTQMALLREAFFNRLCLNEITATQEELGQQLRSYGIDSQASAFQLVCIEVDRINNSRWEKASERRLWTFAIANILGEIMNDHQRVQLFNGPEGRMLCLIEYSHELDEQKVIKSFQSLCSLIKTYLKFTVTIGIGSKVVSIQAIHISYNQSMMALQQKFILGSDQVITYLQLSQETNVKPAISGELQENLLKSLRMNNTSDVKATLDQIFRSLTEGNRSLDYIYVVSMNLISICLSYLSDSGHLIEDCFGEQFYPYSEIVKKETAEQAFQWIHQCFKQAMEYGQLHKMTRAGKTAVQAKQYIEQHYHHSNLHLEDIAGHVYVNSGYLRAIFKKEFGMTVSEYLTYYRMQQAKQLISSGQYKLADIAERVGYNDAGYFSKSFKKFFGMNPSEYETLKS